MLKVHNYTRLNLLFAYVLLFSDYVTGFFMMNIHDLFLISDFFRRSKDIKICSEQFVTVHQSDTPSIWKLVRFVAKQPVYRDFLKKKSAKIQNIAYIYILLYLRLRKKNQNFDRYIFISMKTRMAEYFVTF